MNSLNAVEKTAGASDASVHELSGLYDAHDPRAHCVRYALVVTRRYTILTTDTVVLTERRTKRLVLRHMLPRTWRMDTVLALETWGMFLRGYWVGYRVGLE